MGSLGDLSLRGVKVDYSSWLYLEKYRNGIEKRPNNPDALYTEFPEEYRPKAKPFDLRVYEVDKKACQVFVSSNPDPILLDRYLGGDKIKFPVHPVNLTDPKMPNIPEISKLGFQNIVVSPTASTRTLFVVDDALPPHCLKPHTDMRITRWRRHMEYRKVKHAVKMTKILERSDIFSDKKIGYFPESIGVVYGEGKPEDWGFILREMESKPRLDIPRDFIPLNSLYMKDSKDPSIPLMIVDIIEKSKKDPEVFIKNLLTDLTDGWIKIYSQTGILLEPHGQNVIVELSKDTSEIVRFTHRDFDCEINKDIATAHGFDIDDLNPKDIFSTEGDAYGPKGSHLSLIYDNSMKVVFEKLADVANKYYGIDKSKLQEHMKKHLKEHHSDFLAQFPENQKCYNYQLLDNGKKIIVEKDEKPTWR